MSGSPESTGTEGPVIRSAYIGKPADFVQGDLAPFSAEILYEIIRVLREVFEYPDHILYDWYWLLLTGSELVVPRVTVEAIPEDPDDNKFLACAVEGNADFIVSEDRDLRRLGRYDSIAIVRKHQFLRILEESAHDEDWSQDVDDA
jgi:putative PIN family toxin of toxin-antitoxin system